MGEADIICYTYKKNILSDRSQITTKRDECEIDYTVKRMCLRKKKLFQRRAFMNVFVVVFKSDCLAKLL